MNGKTIKKAAALFAAAFMVFSVRFVSYAYTYDDTWDVIIDARDEDGIKKEDAQSYVNSVSVKLKENEGVLSKRKYTEYSKTVIALSAIGEDPSDVCGYDLLSKLTEFDNVCFQGINGPVWALLALDAAGSDSSIKEQYIEEILRRELPGGGWTLTGTAGDPDVDITAMVLQALAGYKMRKDVRPAINRAVKLLSSLQDENGGYSSYGDSNSESVSQVIIALCALGWSPESYSFTKNGNTAISNLETFKVKEGGFCHIKGGCADPIATEQGRLAETAFYRYKEKKSGLYSIGVSK